MLQTAFANGLLKKRIEAVSKLEELLSQASQVVLAAEKKVLTLARKKQAEAVAMHRIRELFQDAERRLQEEAQQIQVTVTLSSKETPTLLNSHHSAA